MDAAARHLTGHSRLLAHLIAEKRLPTRIVALFVHSVTHVGTVAMVTSIRDCIGRFLGISLQPAVGSVRLQSCSGRPGMLGYAALVRALHEADPHAPELGLRQLERCHAVRPFPFTCDSDTVEGVTSRPWNDQA